VVYPSYRELGQRYGVAHSLVAQYARKHDCQRRRKETKARVTAKVEQKIVELRATAIALSKDDALRMIDTYLMGFEKALSEERVRFDNPADFNTMLRLKEFVLGGADSRQEIHAALSLEDIQARHQRMMRSAQQASALERGEIITVLPVDESETNGPFLSDGSPATPSEGAVGEVTGQFSGPDLAPVPTVRAEPPLDARMMARGTASVAANPGGTGADSAFTAAFPWVSGASPGEDSAAWADEEAEE
jgi:hypothetical protein